MCLIVKQKLTIPEFCDCLNFAFQLGERTMLGKYHTLSKRNRIVAIMLYHTCRIKSICHGRGL